MGAVGGRDNAADVPRGEVEVDLGVDIVGPGTVRPELDCIDMSILLVPDTMSRLSFKM